VVVAEGAVVVVAARVVVVVVVGAVVEAFDGAVVVGTNVVVVAPAGNVVGVSVPDDVDVSVEHDAITTAPTTATSGRNPRRMPPRVNHHTVLSASGAPERPMKQTERGCSAEVGPAAALAAAEAGGAEFAVL
jgi:hypothetical protein